MKTGVIGTVLQVTEAEHCGETWYLVQAWTDKRERQQGEVWYPTRDLRAVETKDKTTIHYAGAIQTTKFHIFSGWAACCFVDDGDCKRLQ